jgi:phenylalanyl-tRNA synthetase beta chain
VRRRLVAAGLAEGIHFAFHDRAWDAAMPALGGVGEPLALANPLSERFAVLRRSLVPNLCAAAQANAARGAAGVALFELGHLFPGLGAGERPAVALIVGGADGEPWQRRPEHELLAVKGLCEALFDELGGAPAVRPAALAGVVEGTGAEWLDAGGEVVGWFGRLAGVEAPYPLFAAELVLDRLPLALAPRPVVPPPRLPGVIADLTLTHARELAWAELATAIAELRRPPLAGFRLKDRYDGPPVPAGAVATTITFEYHGGERTLTQEEVNERHAAIAAELERRHGIGREDS